MGWGWLDETFWPNIHLTVSLWVPPFMYSFWVSDTWYPPVQVRELGNVCLTPGILLCRWENSQTTSVTIYIVQQSPTDETRLSITGELYCAHAGSVCRRWEFFVRTPIRTTRTSDTIVGRGFAECSHPSCRKIHINFIRSYTYTCNILCSFKSIF